ncbi:hypothetical protein R1sor_006631 [Riccia sorocarpa]|uniref:Uncharacterized protein n=1 Tax=Riccia sorocarpa TaxID=122646 RepID=A0ABD3HRU2_9MARC
MVEFDSDSTGVSNRLEGGEFNKWYNVAREADLVDMRLCAMKIGGPLYTRQKKCGDRFDQARLDRCYLSERGEWVYEIAEMIHHGQQCLADHIPIFVRLKLGPEDGENMIKTSHFKMDHRVLEDQGTLDKVLEAWDDHPWIRDPRKKWNLAWERVRQIVREATRNRKVADSRLLELQKQVDINRVLAAEDPTHDNQDKLQQSITTLIRREEQEAKIWKARSRSNWAAEGDAPTRYYFHLTKAKFAKESITSLESEDGNIKETLREINQVIEGHFTTMFQEEQPAEEVLQKQHEALQLIKDKLSSEQKGSMDTEPLIAEVEENIAGMQWEGQDFIYLGILKGCNLDERKVADEIIRKISSKLSHWSTRWLTQPGRMVLLNYVLQAMPKYQILAVGMTEQGISRFESLCRNFVWGWNSEGNPRMATVAWWKLSLKKEDDGLS